MTENWSKGGTAGVFVVGIILIGSGLMFEGMQAVALFIPGVTLIALSAHSILTGFNQA